VIELTAEQRLELSADVPRVIDPETRFSAALMQKINDCLKAALAVS
jgi:hypothetical protein